MQASKKNIVLFTILLTAIGISIFSTLKVYSLKDDLVQSDLLKNELSQKLNTYTTLAQIDSLLLQNNYEEALHAYEDKTNIEGEIEDTSVALRIAVANKFVQMNKGLLAKNSNEPTEEIEALGTTENIPVEQALRKADSLSFILEKTKVQLTRLKRQVKNSTTGKYLTFNSSKGSQIHFVGEVANGKANGHGLALLSTGSRYEGTWKNNLRHGEGTFFWPDGQYYSGTYHNDKREGQGTYQWPNGEKFVGLWENDQRTGEGTFYSKDGKVITGIWKDDKLVETFKKQKGNALATTSSGR